MSNRPRASSSKGHSSSNSNATSSHQGGTESEPGPRHSRKRPASSASASTCLEGSSSSGIVTCRNYSTTLMSTELSPLSDVICSICLNGMNEPTITNCGHTYCHGCIEKTIAVNPRCPKCGTHVLKDKLCPNFAIGDVIARARRNNSKSVTAEIFEATSPLPRGNPPDDVVKLLTNTDYDNLNISDLDRLLMVLHRRREVMASDDDEYKRNLLQEFLSQLLKLKNAHMEQLSREISLITCDLSGLRNRFMVEKDSNLPSTSKEMKIDPCSSSGIGFNTQPLLNTGLGLEQQSITSRKKRMYNHFDELTNVYFDMRNSDTFDNRVNDATVPNGNSEIEDVEGLEKFGKTLSHITQYHSLKPLATLSYSADMLSNSNIVSSIEFDKDNEFFAIAGVTKKIKLFEYVNVIGSSVDIHCPSAELVCNAKISCVAWSNYYKNNLASSDYDGCVSLWDVGTCSKIRSFGEHEKRVWSVDWSNGDPRLLASGSDDSKVKLWSSNNEQSVANLEAKANVCCVKFCPKSTYVIAFGSADHCVHYYDFRNPREPLGVLYGHKKAVSYVKFASKDELVSASTDSNLKLWNLDETMNCVRSFTGHINEKNFVGLATDGNYIACGSENNSLYLYYKYLPKPLFSFKFENHRSMTERPKPDDSPEFVSAVAWKKGSPVVVAANSQGAIKILELI